MCRAEDPSWDWDLRQSSRCALLNEDLESDTEYLKKRAKDALGKVDPEEFDGPKAAANPGLS